MTIGKYIAFTLLFILYYTIGHSQTLKRFNTFSYNVNEGMLQSTIVDAAIDKKNFYWITYPNGIQKFDGKTFYTLSIQKGLSDDKNVRLYVSDKGTLYLSHIFGISKYNIETDKFEEVIKYNTPEQTPLNFLGDHKNCLYILIDYSTYLEIDIIKKEISRKIPTNIRYNTINNEELKPIIPGKIQNRKTYMILNDSLFNINIVNGTYQSYNISYLTNKNKITASNSMGNIDSSYILFGFNVPNAVSNIYALNLQNGQFSEPLIQNTPAQFFSRIGLFKADNMWLLSNENKLYELSNDLSSIKHQWVNFQNKPIGNNGFIRKIIPDNYGNILAVTVNDGIRKIMTNNLPIKYYGIPYEESRHILSIYADKKQNRVLMGTSSNGVFIFDTLQQLVKHIRYNPYDKGLLTVNAIIPTPKGEYILQVSSTPYMLLLDTSLHIKQKIPIYPSDNKPLFTPSYFGTVLEINKQKAYSQSENLVYEIDFNSLSIREHLISTSYTINGLIHQDAIIFEDKDELVFLNKHTFKEFKRVHLPNTSGIRCFTKDKNNHIYIGSNKGIIKIDTSGNVLWRKRQEDGLPDECIYAIIADKDGFVWCSSNKGIFRVNPNGGLLQIRKEDGLQENEFNTGVVFKSDDEEFYFGGVNGGNSFYPQSIVDTKENIQIYLTQIRVNNQPVNTNIPIWDYEKLELSHDNNSLSFDFIAMAPNNPDQYIYQYRMKGVDDEWIQNKDLQTVRYFLPPGKYTLHLFASRDFNKDAQPLKKLEIIIHPPFWKTWWFISLVSALFISTLIYVINRYNKHKYSKRLMQLENEQKIRMERERISRDLHDNIGAFANAVLYKAEEIGRNPDMNHSLVEDLKFASKDIILSLRETIWAFKKDNYTSEECLLRIRNFIQTLVRYYPEVHFSVQEQHDFHTVLSYKRALNLVRLVQEAITNSLKHAQAKNIKIESTIHGNEWMITVQDDGDGFEIEQITKGNGLDNMYKRAEQSNFNVSLNAQTGKGTTVQIRISVL